MFFFVVVGMKRAVGVGDDGQVITTGAQTQVCVDGTSVGV